MSFLDRIPYPVEVVHFGGLPEVRQFELANTLLFRLDLRSELGRERPEMFGGRAWCDLELRQAHRLRAALRGTRNLHPALAGPVMGSVRPLAASKAVRDLAESSEPLARLRLADLPGTLLAYYADLLDYYRPLTDEERLAPIYGLRGHGILEWLHLITCHHLEARAAELAQAEAQGDAGAVLGGQRLSWKGPQDHRHNLVLRLARKGIEEEAWTHPERRFTLGIVKKALATWAGVSGRAATDLYRSGDPPLNLPPDVKRRGRSEGDEELHTVPALIARFERLAQGRADDPEASVEEAPEGVALPTSSASADWGDDLDPLPLRLSRAALAGAGYPALWARVWAPEGGASAEMPVPGVRPPHISEEDWPKVLAAEAELVRRYGPAEERDAEGPHDGRAAGAAAGLEADTPPAEAVPLGEGEDQPEAPSPSRQERRDARIAGSQAASGGGLTIPRGYRVFRAEDR